MDGLCRELLPLSQWPRKDRNRKGLKAQKMAPSLPPEPLRRTGYILALIAMFSSRVFFCFFLFFLIDKITWIPTSHPCSPYHWVQHSTTAEAMIQKKWSQDFRLDLAIENAVGIELFVLNPVNAMPEQKRPPWTSHWTCFDFSLHCSFSLSKSTYFPCNTHS